MNPPWYGRSADTHTVHFAPWYRNRMEIELSDKLAGRFSRAESGLDVAARYLPEDEVLKGYLNRPYGNAYDFDQKDKIEGVF